MDFLLVIGAALGISWVLGQILKALVKAPSTIAYHVSGKAELDKQEILENKARNAKRAIEIENEESERIKKLREIYSLKVKSIENSLKENGIFENILVIFRKGDSFVVDMARFEKLYYHDSYNRAPDFINANPTGPRAGNFSTCIRYFVHGPVISVNIIKNTNYFRGDEIRCFDVPEYTIAKATPEFVKIYDEKIDKPLRDKAEAEKIEKLKIEAAKDKLKSIFK